MRASAPGLLHGAQDLARRGQLPKSNTAPGAIDSPSVACILAGMSRDSLMTQTRKSRNLSLEEVAGAVRTDQANLSRVEKGEQLPKRPLARRLFEFYGGAVPLAAIYDPEFYSLQAE